jgi:mannose-6-phosphate isomerase-like protein (cupin superfamily)
VEFQRSIDLSTGLYVLDAGEADEQEPHTEDEIYVCVSGRARFVTPDGDCDVLPGTVIFVPANQEHRFVDITERLAVVVVFGPAEGSRS